MPRYIKGKPGIQMPRKTEGGQAALHWTVLPCSCGIAGLCAPHSSWEKAAQNSRSCSAVSRILIWADNTMQRAKCSASQIAVRGRSCVMMCQLNSWEIEQTDTESLEQPYEVFSFPPCCGEGPRLTLRWHLIALVTSYNIHKIPRHLTLQCMKSSSVFFLLHKNNFFLINQDNY